MRIIPVIDLRAGEAVQGTGGDRARYAPVKSALTSSLGDALALAQAYVAVLGTSELYVADLDAIEGGAAQYGMHQRLSRIARSWIDAGLRSERDACAVIDAGADRVAFSLDLRDGAPLANAEALRAMAPRELARRAVDAGVETVIVLDLARVGGLGGADEAMLGDLRAALPGVDLISGGGIRDQADLDRLAAAGADGALVATAVHRGAIGRRGA